MFPVYTKQVYESSLIAFQGKSKYQDFKAESDDSSKTNLKAFCDLLLYHEQPEAYESTRHVDCPLTRRLLVSCPRLAASIGESG